MMAITTGCADDPCQMSACPDFAEYGFGVYLDDSWFREGVAPNLDSQFRRKLSEECEDCR